MSSANTAAARQNGNYGNALKSAQARAAEINRNPAREQFRALQTAYQQGQTDRKTPKTTLQDLHIKKKHVVEKYAVAETRQLMDKITTTLPISIRAAIFHYIWDPRTAKEAFYAAGSPFYSDTPWLVHCTHSPCQCFRVDQLPLFTQHQIVGLPTAREAVAAYYAAMPPDRLGDDIELLKDFLARDHFHVGVVPAEHIRHLRITISPIECEILPMEINGNICMSSHGHAVVARELQHLDNLKHKDGFRLTVVLGKGIWGARAEKAMEAFRETYEGLRSEGVEFRVYGKASRAYYPVLRIDGYYGMKREKWYAFVEGQVKDKGEFQAECSDDEDGMRGLYRVIG